MATTMARALLAGLLVFALTTACGRDGSKAVCGDSITEGPEQCDDGNMVAIDGCENDCTVTPAETFCQTIAPIASGTCEITAGDASKLIIGDILSPFTILKGGEVTVDATGVITCVACDCSAEATGATEIRCPSGVVSPGLINSHDHITFVHNAPYNDSGERYEHRHDWRRGLNGHTQIPSSGGASTAQIRAGELRFLFGGATSTVGSGSATGFLRNLDRGDQEGLGQPPVHYDTFPLGDANATQLATGCGYPNIQTSDGIASDDAYYPHISEGIDAFARNEFVCTSTMDGGGQDLLEPQSAYIHSIGLSAIEYGQMASQRTSLIWSPRSNITLYGDTAQVTTAARMGVRIALGTDWMPTGSMNLQRELACADSLNRDYFDGFFDDRELWRMVTLYGAQTAAVDDVVGILAAGKRGDIAIFDGSTNAGYRAVIDAASDDTALVLRDGQAVFGDDALVIDLGLTGCDAIDMCGRQKRLCSSADIGMTFAALETAANMPYPLFFCDLPTNEPSCVPARPAGVNGSSVYTGTITASDGDGDGIPDGQDNCPAVFNPVRPVDNGMQANSDLDADGDACDVCPIEANATDCAPIDPNDADGDGVTDSLDNCPQVPNSDQADGDMDDKGDLCDACPNTANPGALACTVSIYDIKQGNVTGSVGLQDALVTGCRSGSGFFMQVKDTDPGFSGAEFSGIYVFHPTVVCGTDVSPGDRVDMNPATVNNFFGQIQLANATFVVTSSGEAAPAPVVVTPAVAGGNVATSLEAVLVRVENVVVTELEPPAGPGDSNPNNEFVVDDALRVNDFLHLANPMPIVGAGYTSITGLLSYRNNNSKLEPRTQADLVLGAAFLLSLSPAQSYLRDGDAGVTTIPDPLTVTLSSPATADTFVAVTSADPTSVTVVGGGATVLLGQTTAVVLLNALQPTANTTLTATLDLVMQTADVRVLGVGDQPQVAAVSPASIIVAPSDTATLAVLLDIPADPGGSTVLLSLNPGTFGSVPVSVLVPADTMSATFTFTAGAMEGNETLSATLGTTANAAITVGASGSLVINEVDYDQPSTDTDEFVEILNGSGSPVDLSNMILVFVNGNDSAEYGRVDLSSAGTLSPGEYLVVGSSTLLPSVPGGVKTIALAAASNNVQNGAPDALGIVDLGNNMLMDALSYEGSVIAGVVAGVGTFNFVEGTATSAEDNNSTAGSLVRQPNGADTDDAATDWGFTSTPSPGTAN